MLDAVYLSNLILRDHLGDRLVIRGEAGSVRGWGVKCLFGAALEFANIGRTDFQGQTPGITLHITVSAGQFSWNSLGWAEWHGMGATYEL
jgi:hypothetical protein